MAKVRQLGTVSKVFDSGISLTNKGIKVIGRFNIGDVLILDMNSKKISKKVDKPKNNTKSENDTKIEEQNLFDNQDKSQE